MQLIGTHHSNGRCLFVFGDHVKFFRIHRNTTLEDVARALDSLPAERHGVPVAINVVLDRKKALSFGV